MFVFYMVPARLGALSCVRWDLFSVSCRGVDGGRGCIDPSLPRLCRGGSSFRCLLALCDRFCCDMDRRTVSMPGAGSLGYILAQSYITIYIRIVHIDKNSG